MRVVFGSRAVMGPLTGVGQYAWHVATGLARRPDIDLTCFDGNRFSSQLVPRPLVLRGRARAAVRRLVPGSYTIRRTVEQMRFNSRRGEYDLYHEPNFLALQFDGPTVITVHDLSWIRFPETHPVERVRAMDRYFEGSLRGASLVLTDSEFVKQEILEVFGGDADRILSVPLGVDPVFGPQDADASSTVLARLGLRHGGYFLSVGTLEPRKNLAAALEAFRQLPQELRQRFPLVLAGVKGWHTSSIERLLEPLVRSGDVRVLGYLERAELAQVTAGAVALVYPSLYEGFGLPPLEAMACGVPPIVSTAGALVELVGDAGLVVAPDDVAALGAAMERMALDPALRASLSKLGRERAASFTWERCVSGTIAAYRRAAGARPATYHPHSHDPSDPASRRRTEPSGRV